MKLTKDQRDRMLLTAVLTVVGVAVVYQLLVRGTMERLKTAKAAVVKSQKRFEDADRFLKMEAPANLERLGEHRARLDAIESNMASSVDPFGWSDRLVRDFARNKKVEIKQVSRGEGDQVKMLPESPYKAVIFRVNGVAGFWEFGDFLASFENAYPVFQVFNLKLVAGGLETGGDLAQGAGGDKGTAKVSFQFDVVAMAKPNPS